MYCLQVYKRCTKMYERKRCCRRRRLRLYGDQKDAAAAAVADDFWQNAQQKHYDNRGQVARRAAAGMYSKSEAALSARFHACVLQHTSRCARKPSSSHVPSMYCSICLEDNSAGRKGDDVYDVYPMYALYKNRQKDVRPCTPPRRSKEK